MTGRRYAILVASSTFPEEPRLQPLRCPPHDVDGMQAVLAAPELGGFADTIVLKDVNHSQALRAINRTLKQAAKDDLVLVYYSGHGSEFSGLRAFLEEIVVPEGMR